jgi:hypothetical protein
VPSPLLTKLESRVRIPNFFFLPCASHEPLVPKVHEEKTHRGCRPLTSFFIHVVHQWQGKVHHHPFLLSSSWGVQSPDLFLKTCSASMGEEGAPSPVLAKLELGVKTPNYFFLPCAFHEPSTSKVHEEKARQRCKPSIFLKNCCALAIEEGAPLPLCVEF